MHDEQALSPDENSIGSAASMAGGADVDLKMTAVVRESTLAADGAASSAAHDCGDAEAGVGTEPATDVSCGDRNADDNPNDPHGMPSREAFGALVAEANAGDQEALTDLRELLDRCPQIWQHIGNLAVIAEATLIDLIAGNDRLAAESLQRSIREMKTKLMRPGSDFLDELAVARVVSCWLSLQHSETALTRSEAGTIQAKFWLKRQAQADRAYHAAMRSLGSIRKMQPVATQTPQQVSAPVAASTSTVEARQCDGVTIPIAPYLDAAPADQMAGTRAAVP